MFRSAENRISVFRIHRKRNCYPWPNAILRLFLHISPDSFCTYLSTYALYFSSDYVDGKLGYTEIISW